jgi:hypothetical protein
MGTLRSIVKLSFVTDDSNSNELLTHIPIRNTKTPKHQNTQGVFDKKTLKLFF